ncbi:tetratricopeptide repeat protein [Stenotrophomonas sp.]|uniref:tetratricopeptide repeat protein n=1 Tax=Stenotrophomonas sp. TaxID=69392 RepID=UPI00289E41AB|nr:tetratricopeptide repeat protein [Stenotrophomonas sp.]
MADANGAWYSEGDVLFERGRFAEALAAFRCAYLADRSDHFALMAMANSASELGQARRAARYLKLALRLVPDDATLWFNLGNALFDIGDYQAALQAYARVPADNPAGAAAKRNAALAASRLAVARR